MNYKIVDGDIPTVFATMKDMDEFATFIEKCEAKGIHKYGLFKVKPPTEWHPRPSDPEYKNIKTFKVKNTVVQNRRTTGNGTGCFLQFGEPSKKKFTAQDFQGVNFLGPPDVNPKLNNDFLEFADKQYFKNMAHQKSLYGSDFTGSLFDTDTTGWNIQNLPSCLKLLDLMGVTIEGVNTPYLYFGSWASTFPWHTEDMDMHSINYLHNVPKAQFPKRWWVIPPEEGHKFERLMIRRFPQQYKNCKVFWRHKTVIIPPKVLIEKKIKFYQTVHWPGEFMITCPYAYHMGYNLGPNVAESTNFATRRWVDYLKEATYCEKCNGRVYINPKFFLKIFQPDQYKDWKRRFEEDGKRIEPQHTINPPLKETTWEDDVENFVKLYNEKRRKKKENWKDRTIEQILNPRSTNPNTQKNGVKRKAISCTLKNKKRLRTDISDKTRINPVAKTSLNKNQVELTGLSNGENDKSQDECLMHQSEPVESPNDHNLGCCICSVLSTCQNNGILKTESKKRLNKALPLIKKITFKCSEEFPRIKDLKNYIDKKAEESSKLLSCCVCNITVHARCYGVLKEAYSDDATKKWKCEVCASKVRKPECIICKRKDGALKTVSGSTRWAHVQCVMATNGCYIKYVHGDKFEIKVAENDKRKLKKSCCYCQNSEFTIKCCNNDCKFKNSEDTFFHFQCATYNNQYIKQKTFPNSLIMYCSGCSNKHQNTYSCKIDDSVIFINEKNEYREGKIDKLTREFMHSVYFVEEDELSDDILQKYIINHNWDNFPNLNQPVEVLWGDGETYVGVYRGFRVTDCYEVSDIESENNECQVLEKGVDFVKRLSDCQLFELELVANPSNLLKNYIKKKTANSYREVMRSTDTKLNGNCKQKKSKHKKNTKI